MEIKNASSSLSKLLGKATEPADIESVHQTQVDIKQLEKVVANPKSVVRAAGIKVSAQSQVHVTVKQRARRKMVSALRRIIIIIIHYRNCDADVIIFL